MMRTVSAAMASWAWSVEAPMWCVPYTPGSETIGSAKVPVADAGSCANTSRPTRIPFSRKAAEHIGVDQVLRLGAESDVEAEDVTARRDVARRGGELDRHLPLRALDPE